MHLCICGLYIHYCGKVKAGTEICASRPILILKVLQNNFFSFLPKVSLFSFYFFSSSKSQKVHYIMEIETTK